MKYITFTVLLCALASLAHGFCMLKEPLKQGATHCRDDVDGTWHAVGSTWVNSECLRCTCEDCCSVYIPTLFPPQCVSVLDKTICKYVARNKDDPSTPCDIGPKQ